MRRLASIAAVVLVALAFAAQALADNAGLTPVDPKSPNAEAISDTYYLLLVVTGVVFVAVEVALVVFLLKYRRRNRSIDAEGPQIHGNTQLEVMWTVVPVILVAIVVGFVFYKLPDVTDVTRAASEPAGEQNLVIDVEGRQFYWQFTYPDGSITYDTMVVPVERTVELNVAAADFDVIHSWWIPALGGKIDAIPGRRNHTWFRAEAAGEYQGNCTEFCGLQHAEMTMSVRAVDQGAYEAELASLAANGQAQFAATCGKCHNLRGPQLVGPTLGGNPTLADRKALETLLREGRGEMPAIGRGWTDAQLDTLFAFTRRAAGGEQ